MWTPLGSTSGDYGSWDSLKTILARDEGGPPGGAAQSVPSDDEYLLPLPRDALLMQVCGADVGVRVGARGNGGWCW